MQKQVLLLAVALALLPIAEASAQSQGNGGRSSSQPAQPQRTNVLLFNNYQDSGFNFQIKLDPKASVQAAATPGQYTVNGQPLYVKAVPATPFAAGSDTATLRRYGRSEMRRLLGSMPITVHPYVRVFSDRATGRQCFLWGFGMPEALDKSLDGVVYLYFIDANQLLSLASTQPKGQPMRQTLDVLFGAVQGYASASTPFPKPR